MNFLQNAVLRYTPAPLQDLGLSIWGYQIHRFRYTSYFHRRLAELESTTTACMNVTHLDALVYARSAFNSSMNYRSATVFGSPRLIEDPDEKLHALRVISECTMPGRWDEVRDSHEKEIKMTGVIAMAIESASAKISAGMPDDEEEDYEIPIWAGILPLRSAFTSLQSDDRLIDGVEPSHVLRAMEGKVL